MTDTTAPHERVIARASRGVRPGAIHRLAASARRHVHGLALPCLFLLCTLFLLSAQPASAGVMNREQLQALFPAPLTVGERDAKLPVWPVFKQDATATVLAGYLFESIDLAPLPGFSGTPIDLLVALDAEGRYLDVRVLSHHEPVFLDGLGEAPLFKFVAQYRGLSLQQNVKIGTNTTQGDRAGSANVYIDGVAKATASVRIVNQTLLAAALTVARAKMGYAAGRDPSRIGRVVTDRFEPLDWNGLVRAGLVQHAAFSRDTVERAFDGTAGAGQGGRGAAPFVECWVALLDVPSAGRNLLDARGWQHLQNRLQPGDHALLVVGRGDATFVGENFVRGAVPDRLTLQQGDLPIELRDLDLDDPLALPASLRGADAKVFRVIGPAGLDPSLPMRLALRVTRSKGIVYPERVSRDFALPFALPAAYAVPAEPERPRWHAVWRARLPELAAIGVALSLLTALLARPRWLVADQRRLERVRIGFLVFTLVFVGWIAQGQLSIVNITALVSALREGRSLGFFLYDPVSLVLWAFVGASLLVWGRGTFCGWLCPYGALQELAALLARRLGVKRLQLHRRLDARLKALKFVLLALVLGTAAISGPWTDGVVEIEPFKTAITLNFVRHWPFVVWAAGLVALGTVVFKGYCRYVCPLGAALALLGRVRMFAWIARRAECGQPCQTCRHRCAYQAIRTDGSVHYEECFQCMDCVAIHASEQRCAPLIAERRADGRRVIPIRVAPDEGGAR